MCEEEGIIVTDDSGKEVNVTSETEIGIIINEANINCNEIPTGHGNPVTPIVDTYDDINQLNVNRDYKDALLASLYSQCKFLKKELKEKKLLIRTLLIKEPDVYNLYPSQ